MFKTLTSLFFLLTNNGGFCVENSIVGVSMELLSFYDPLKNFTCQDGSFTMPFSYVNDDYCDCPDGTDEPGTSACPNGIFHCTNKGFVPKNIPSGFINDGFCDCCDASDEMHYTNCTDNCEQLALEAKLLAEEMHRRLTEGSIIRAQMIESAKKVLEKKQLKASNLEILKNKAIILKKEAETVKKEAEFQEAAALAEYAVKEEEISNTLSFTKEHFEEIDASHSFFNSFDIDKNRLIEKDELKAIKIFDHNFDGAVTDEELNLAEDIVSGPIKFEGFHHKIWPRLKTSVNQMKTKADQQKLSSLEFNQSEEKANIKLNEKINELARSEELVVNRGYTDPAGFDESTGKLVKAANDARKQFATAEKVLLDLERELANLKSALSKDYGEENEFALLNDQCFDYTHRGYSYKFCPFNLVTQVGEPGDSEIRLGTWAGWIGNNYSEMLYDGGQHCHNGPLRSTKVRLTCGLTNEVASVTEPNKCEYIIQFNTPAACRLDTKPRDVHEEL